MTRPNATADASSASSPPDPAAVFDDHRALLHGVAYRVLGRVADAEDVVQEAWLRWSRVDHAEIRDPRAFLVRTTTRLGIDRLRRIRARRETYVGEWLPEPIRTAPDVAERAELADSVSVAMLVVLETLSPLERAVFVLREAFGFSHAEIAEVLDRTEPAVRQVARRARDHVEARRTRYESDARTRREVTDRFLHATLTGDLPALMAVLAPGVSLVADGGGKVRAPLLPVLGAEKVARFLVAAAGRPLPEQRIERTALNGSPGVVVFSGPTPVSSLHVEVSEGRVQRLWIVANPDKLGGLESAPV